jgi:hypothetical protein
MENRLPGIRRGRSFAVHRLGTVLATGRTLDAIARNARGAAARSGWHIVKIYEDTGIGGAKGRDKRPGLDAMLRAVNAKEFDIWSLPGQSTD